LDARAEISNSKSAQRCSDDIKPAQRPQRFASAVANTMMVRTIPETQSILLKIARERWREERTSHVIEHEVVLCEDGTTAMVYFYFGLLGDDARELGVEDICGIFYDFDAPVSEPDFDCDAAAAAFTNVVASINSVAV
jgi:hypothetical protein